MKPKKMHEHGVQGNIFRSRLGQIISHEHPLYKLSHERDWRVFEEEFGVLSVEKAGQYGLYALEVSLHARRRGKGGCLCGLGKKTRE